MKTIKKLNDKIGAFDAKTHLSELLNKVQEGHTITITKRGKPVAQLVPCRDKNLQIKKTDILNEFEQIRTQIKGKVDIKSFINEGRKY